MAKKRTRKKKTTTKQVGRPKGRSNNDVVVAHGTLTRCPRCGSTDRTGYMRSSEQAFSGIKDGNPYTHVVRKWTKCRKCNQHRIDRLYENRI